MSGTRRTGLSNLTDVVAADKAADGCSGVSTVVVGKAANHRADVVRINGLQHPLKGLSSLMSNAIQIGYRSAGSG